MQPRDHHRQGPHRRGRNAGRARREIAASQRRHAKTPDRAKSVLSAIGEIDGITSPGDGQLFVQAKNGAPIITPVSSALRENDIAVDEITVERGRLDEVFRQITTQQSAHA